MRGPVSHRPASDPENVGPIQFVGNLERRELVDRLLLGLKPVDIRMVVFTTLGSGKKSEMSPLHHRFCYGNFLLGVACFSRCSSMMSIPVSDEPSSQRLKKSPRLMMT